MQPVQRASECPCPRHNARIHCALQLPYVKASRIHRALRHPSTRVALRCRLSHAPSSARVLAPPPIRAQPPRSTHGGADRRLEAIDAWATTTASSLPHTRTKDAQLGARDALVARARRISPLPPGGASLQASTALRSTKRQPNPRRPCQTRQIATATVPHRLFSILTARPNTKAIIRHASTQSMRGSSPPMRATKQ